MSDIENLSNIDSEDYYNTYYDLGRALISATAEQRLSLMVGENLGFTTRLIETPSVPLSITRTLLLASPTSLLNKLLELSK